MFLLCLEECFILEIIHYSWGTMGFESHTIAVLFQIPTFRILGENCLLPLGFINDFTKLNLCSAHVHLSKTYYFKSLKVVTSKKTSLQLDTLCNISLFSSPFSCRINGFLEFGIKNYIIQHACEHVKTLIFLPPTLCLQTRRWNNNQWILLGLGEIMGRIMSTENCYVELPNPNTSKCECIWKQGYCRCNS